MFQENSIETCILSRVKQITSPGWMHETSARTWCTGKTQRDRVEREVEGGIGMGNTCKSMADSCQCMTKPLQYCKVISLQLIKINGKKNKVWIYWLVDLATPFLTYIWDKCVCVCVHAQLCLTLCNPMNCSLLGYSVHMILQAGILEWIVIPFSRACSQPRDWTCLSCDSWI